MMDLKPHTCAECRFWHKSPPNPQNLREVKGECRHSPPAVTQLPVQSGMMKLSGYPELPPSFPICGQFQAMGKIEV